VPEQRGLELARWGEELRRLRLARRSARFRTGATAIAAVAVTALALTLLWPPRPVLVWNASTSSPAGLYRVGTPHGLEAGDMVVAWPPRAVRRLAAERRYVPFNVPLVKRVAAVPGDRVCAVGEALYVNGRLEALRRSRDGAGRPMMWWTGCEDVGEGRLLLLASDAPDAFDGRYFGMTETRDVVGSARLLWAR
jgi:conjugative transfer signal peptidase TraF